MIPTYYCLKLITADDARVYKNNLKQLWNFYRPIIHLYKRLYFFSYLSTIHFVFRTMQNFSKISRLVDQSCLFKNLYKSRCTWNGDARISFERNHFRCKRISKNGHKRNTDCSQNIQSCLNEVRTSKNYNNIYITDQWAETASKQIQVAMRVALHDSSFPLALMPVILFFHVLFLSDISTWSCILGVVQFLDLFSDVLKSEIIWTIVYLLFH